GLVHAAAARGHRVRGADVRRRRHRRHVRGHRDEDARRRRTSTGRRDVHDHRQRSVEQALADHSHRTLEPARRVELDDERGRSRGLRAVDGRLHQSHHHGTDDALERDAGDRCGDGRRGESEEEKRDRGNQRGHAGARPFGASANSVTISNMRLAASSDVTWPGPSYGGETSTTSAPTRFIPASPRNRASASYEVSPPTSGVPVAGAYAGSTASISNEM